MRCCGRCPEPGAQPSCMPGQCDDQVALAEGGAETPGLLFFLEAPWGTRAGHWRWGGELLTRGWPSLLSAGGPGSL